MADIIHHIPVCPFSQRVEILLALKGLSDEISFCTVDITKPRDPALLELSKGTTALPVMEVPGKTAIKESRVILRFVEQSFTDRPVARIDPHEHALESFLVQKEGDFTMSGYRFAMNQNLDQRQTYLETHLAQYKAINDILVDYAPGETWFFEGFGWAETVFTPMFMRFWMLEYYEGFALPDDPAYDRVRRWRAACLDHPAAQQVCHDQIVKLYYDYAKGVGNGALVTGRKRSSFVFDPHWQDRPIPPADKYGYSASDAELGLI